MKLKSRKSGISLISLIITIIVIIILAAIVIFSGMDTPEKAQLSKVISDIDNVQTAVDQAYYGLYTEKAVAGEVWTPSQFYEAVATGKTNREDLTATGLVEIAEDSLVDINLPVYEGRKWYIAVSDVSDTVKTGSAVLSPGFESQGKTYATLLDIQNGGSDGAGSNGGNNGGQESLTEEEKALLASINVGDYVNYMGTDVTSSKGIEGEGDEENPVYWRVIDKNEETGEVLITTSDAVGEIELSGAENYVQMVSILDQYCKANYTATGAKTVRSMTVEDVNKLSYLYEEEQTGKGKAAAILDPITEIPIGDADALAQKFGYEYGRYAYYSYDTPDELVKDVTINGKIYHGAKVYDNGDIHKFYVYDDNNGNRHIAEANNEGTNGYRVPKYENGEATPVLVSFDHYNYQMPSEATDIIGYGYSWLASACVGTGSDLAAFFVRFVDDGYVAARYLCYSDGDEDGRSLGLRPVVSLSSKLLEEGSAGGDVTGGYNSWKLK